MERENSPTPDIMTCKAI